MATHKENLEALIPLVRNPEHPHTQKHELERGLEVEDRRTVTTGDKQRIGAQTPQHTNTGFLYSLAVLTTIVHR